MQFRPRPGSLRSSSWVLGVLCGAGAAISWAIGLVAAKHGIGIGFAPADLALHRFAWAGLVLLPMVARAGLRDLGGIGWGRALALTVCGGSTQALASYAGFVLVPLAHGAVIQPSCAALGGLMMATLILGEDLPLRRILGGLAIVVGLVVLGAEALNTIGGHGLAGDFSFMMAGLMWATFGTLLRLWQIAGPRAAAVVAVVSLLLFTPVHGLVVGYDHMIAAGWGENALQMVAQGFFAGVLPITLFGRAITLLGAGRAATFPALVPAFTMAIGAVVLGEMPTLLQLAGLAIVVLGFRLVLR